MTIVTGAFSYSGKYLTKLLVERGEPVRTLTGHPDRANPFGSKVEVARMDFSDPDGLVEAMKGAHAFVNTYWIRFPYRGMTFERAVENSKLLFDAASRAGVGRIVHTSITNPSLQSPLGYYRGKAQVEEHLKATGIPFTILRPNVIFGREDVLINNIAWVLRNLPLFGVPGSGKYGMQPTFVEDYAALMLASLDAKGSETTDACGPEAFAFGDWVRRIAEAIGRPARIVHMPPSCACWASALLGIRLKDVVLTREEVRGLMSGLLVSTEPAKCLTKLSDWLSENAHWLGKDYANEVGRHFK